MNMTINSDAIKVENDKLYLLDQTQLPHKEFWLACEDLETMVDAIVQLKVRGAPLIGVAASLFVGIQATKLRDYKQIGQMIDALYISRPTAVNLMHLLDEQKALLTARKEFSAFLQLAYAHFHEDVSLCQRIAEHGLSLIRDNDRILTHCNAGSLATAGIGTAVGVIKMAAKQRQNISVYVDETRPLLQGGRLTAWECVKHDIQHQIICDNMAGYLMQQKQVDVIITGADRICLNGDLANKIGTYSLAVLAKYHDIPFYIAAPYTTVDKNCAQGEDIVIEQRRPEEVKGYLTTQWAPTHSKTYNPAFDVTPAELVTGYILDSGIYTSEQLQGLN